jgi:hypothetical protein
MAVDINRIYLGFITFRDAPGGPIGYFTDVSQQTFVFKNAIYSFQVGNPWFQKVCFTDTKIPYADCCGRRSSGKLDSLIIPQRLNLAFTALSSICGLADSMAAHFAFHGLLWCNRYVTTAFFTPRLPADAMAATSIGSVYTVSQITPQSSNIFFKTTGQWITAFYAATFTCNALATRMFSSHLRHHQAHFLSIFSDACDTVMVNRT